MIEESLFKTNFIGRDGFRWWIGQIAPAPPGSAHAEQLNGSGWGSRYKVRIMGYHPDNEVDLPNDELPWAGCLMPTTTGSGGACLGVNTKLVQGDVVVGFFLDGDDAQIPMIMGTFGRTGDIKPSPYKSPFEPFTGYTERIKKPNGTLTSNESVGQNAQDSKSPRSVDGKTAARLNQEKGPAESKEITSSPAIGTKVTLADTCEDTVVKNMINEVLNLLTKIEATVSAVANLPNELNKSVEIIASLANNLVGQMFNALYGKMEGLLRNGLDLFYKATFAKVFAATRNKVKAHLAGVEAQKSMLGPVKLLEEGISCIASSIVNGLESTIKELLNEVISNVTNFVSCAGLQFAGAFLNKIVDDVVSGMSSVLGGVAKILSPLFKVSDFLRSAIGVIKSIGGLFDCNQNKKKCPAVKEVTIGKGMNKSSKEDDDFQKILDNMKVSKAVGNLASDFERQYGKWDIFGDGTKLSDYPPSPTGNCYTGPCIGGGGPEVRIFGGGGGGAVAKAITGALVQIGSKTTASCIGVEILDPGSGYKFPPFVEIVDECGEGYGAIARSLVDHDPLSPTYGQVISIYIVSPGENYPVENVQNVGVSAVSISDPGNGYSPSDFAVDNFGNQYQLTTEFGRIISANPINSIVVTDIPTITVITETGEGAILNPILHILPAVSGVGIVTTIVNSIDCIT